MVFTTLGFMLGTDCNAKCRSCMWGEQLNTSSKMSVKEACEWIDQAHALGNLMLLGFSGGEPFLHLDDLKAIARYANLKYNLPFSVSTNCFWAKSLNKAKSILISLYELGLRELLVSVDDFHQEYIALDCVKNCLDAAKKVGIHCTIQCIRTLSSHKLNYFLDALGVSKQKNISYSELPCTPVGSAAIRIPAEEFPMYSKIPADYCTIFRGLILHPDGSVNLCCGPAFNVKALLAGNLHHEKLEKIIARAEWNPLYNALALGNGPRLLAEILRENGYSNMVREKYSTSCHACHHILSQLHSTSILKKLLEPQRAELFLRRTILDQETINRKSDILKF